MWSLSARQFTFPLVPYNYFALSWLGEDRQLTQHFTRVQKLSPHIPQPRDIYHTIRCVKLQPSSKVTRSGHQQLHIPLRSSQPQALR
jgi:hypothetical protein